MNFSFEHDDDSEDHYGEERFDYDDDDNDDGFITVIEEGVDSFGDFARVI